MVSINTCCGEHALEPDRLNKVFEMWWPDLKKSLDAIPEDDAEATSNKQTTSNKQADLTKFSSIFRGTLRPYPRKLSITTFSRDPCPP